MAADPSMHDVKINIYEDNSAIILRQMLCNFTFSWLLCQASGGKSGLDESKGHFCALLL